MHARKPIYEAFLPGKQIPLGKILSEILGQNFTRLFKLGDRILPPFFLGKGNFLYWWGANLELEKFRSDKFGVQKSLQIFPGRFEESPPNFSGSKFVRPKSGKKNLRRLRRNISDIIIFLCGFFFLCFFLHVGEPFCHILTKKIPSGSLKVSFWCNVHWRKKSLQIFPGHFQKKSLQIFPDGF